MATSIFRKNFPQVDLLQQKADSSDFIIGLGIQKYEKLKKAKKEMHDIENKEFLVSRIQPKYNFVKVMKEQDILNF